MRAPAFGVAALLLAARVTGQCGYTWTAIPNPPGTGETCYAWAINNHGHVTGSLVSLAENQRAFVWTPEAGTRALPRPSGISDMIANDINDHGWVVGSATGAAGSFAFVWDGFDCTLIPPPVWATSIYGHSINNDNVVVGKVVNVLTGPTHAFRWEYGAFVDLHPQLLGEDSIASAITDSGIVIGDAQEGVEAGYVWHSFALSAAGPQWLENPGPLGARIEAEGANSNGFVFGLLHHDAPFRKQGIVWTPWGIELLPLPTSHRDVLLTGMNNAGRAVGYYDRRLNSSFPSWIPIIWQDSVLYAFPSLLQGSPPPSLRGLFDINDDGQIIGHFNPGSALFTATWTVGDLTGDCHVGLDDLLIVLSSFGSPIGTNARGDVDLDGDVDLADLTCLLADWGN